MNVQSKYHMTKFDRSSKIYIRKFWNGWVGLLENFTKIWIYKYFRKSSKDLDLRNQIAVKDFFIKRKT